MLAKKQKSRKMGAMTVKFGSFCLFVTLVVQENAGCSRNRLNA